MKTSRGESIGAVVYLEGRGVVYLKGYDEWSATLDGEDNPEMAGLVKIRYMNEYAGPQDGPYGHAILEDLAGTLAGVAVYDLMEIDRSVVY